MCTSPPPRGLGRPGHLGGDAAEPVTTQGLEPRGALASPEVEPLQVFDTQYMPMVLAPPCLPTPILIFCDLNLFDSLVFFFLKREFSQFPILPFFCMLLNGMNS